MDPIVATLIAGLGGAIVGSLLTVWGSINISKAASRNDANARFYEVIVKAIARMERDDTQWPYFILVDYSWEHLYEAKKFRFHLSHNERKRFDKAWREYFGPGSISNFEEWFPNKYHIKNNESIDNERLKQHYRDIALNNMKTLLTFTE